MRIDNPEVKKSVELAEKATNEVDNNSLFQDSSDNVIKLKDNNGMIKEIINLLSPAELAQIRSDIADNMEDILSFGIVTVRNGGNVAHTYTAISASDLHNADYIIITATYHAQNADDRSSVNHDRDPRLTINKRNGTETYSSVYTYTDSAAISAEGRNEYFRFRSARTIQYIHTLTSDDKSQGLQFQITTADIDTGANIQTTFRLSK